MPQGSILGAPGIWMGMNRRRVYLLICVASSVSMVGWGLTTPLLPLFAGELGASTVLIGMAVSGFWITRTFVEVPSGYLSDRIGPKTPMILGLSLSGISSFLSASARDPYQLVLARGLWGLGSALFFCTAMALTVEILGAGASRHGRGRCGAGA
ncbi:MAG: MFS transporter [Candidatus Bathyarchaeia archaeon]